MARLKAAFEGGLVSHNEKKQSSKLKSLGTKAVAVVGVSTAAVFGVGAAHADETNIYVGGNADPTSQLPVDAAMQQGRYDPNDNNMRIHYPASIAVFGIGGPARMDQSIADGAPKVVDAWRANKFDEKVRLDCFSLGSAVCNVAAAQIARESGGALPGNVEVVRNGDGYGVTGILNHPLKRTFEPILKPIMEDMVGIPLDTPQLPGTINRLDINDFWANGGSQGLDIGALIAMVSTIPQNHRIPDPREPHVTFVDKFGVINEIYGGDRDAITKAIEAAGYVVPPIGEAFFDVIAGPNNPANDPHYNQPAPPPPPPVPEPVRRAEVQKQIIEDVVPNWNKTPVAPAQAVVDDIAENVVPDFTLADPLDLGF